MSQYCNERNKKDCKCNCRQMTGTHDKTEITKYYLTIDAFNERWRCKRCGCHQTEVPEDAIKDWDGFYKGRTMNKTLMK